MNATQNGDKIRQYFLNKKDDVIDDEIKTLIFETHHDYVMEQIREMLKIKISPELEKEAFNMCWVAIYENLKTYTPIWEFKSFLRYSIVKILFELNKTENLTICFLDIDGVVATLDSLYDELSRFFGVTHDEVKNGNATELCEKTGLYYPDVNMRSWPFSQNAIDNLYRLQRETGCMFVMSSTWRRGLSTDGINELMSTKGLKIKFIDKTPSLGDRGEEIQKWLDDYKYKVHQYVIIDDDSADIIKYHPNNLVKTDFNTGFTSEKCDEAIKILKNAR